MNKKFGLTLMMLCALLVTKTQAQDVWVSDEIEAPLRSAPELNSKIVGLLPAGERVTALDQNDDYVKVKTSKGVEGWLSNYYVLRQQSVHDKFLPMEKSLKSANAEVKKLRQQLAEKDSQIKQLQGDVASVKSSADAVAQRAKDSESGAAKLTSDNTLLQQKLTEQSDKMEQLAKALEVTKRKATDARSRYLSLVKVSENAVDIDKQNQSLQKKAVQFEQELQQLKTENQSLKSQIGKKEFLIGVLTVLGGILVGYVLSVMMPPRGRRGGGGSYSSL